MEALYWPVLSCALTAAVIGVLLKTGWAGRLALDRANHRSLHQGEIPRSGGLAIMFSIAVATLAALGEWGLPVRLALLLAVVSWLDDRIGLGVGIRLAVHVAAAAIGVLSLPLEIAGLPALALILLTVWATNGYNFMDGANGLAGGMTLIGFGLLGAAFAMAGQGAEALGCGIIAAAALGFLFFNFDPARIFMGDAGSIPLGFLAALFSIRGWQQGLWPGLFPMLVFLPFLADASWTLLRRLLRGEAFWRPHREHVYQRLIRLGWSHRRVALAYYAWMLAAGLSGFSLLPRWTPFTHWDSVLAIGWLLAVMAVFAGFGRYWQQRMNEHL